MNFKDILKKAYYSFWGRKIRYIPKKIVFNIRAEKHKKYLIDIEKKERKEKVTVFFILNYPEMWNSIKSVYEAFAGNDSVIAKVICCPRHNKNDAYNYMISMGIDAVCAYDEINSSWYELKANSPQYIFYSRPYAKEYPLLYRPSKVSKYAKICYIPYGFEFVKGYHLEVEYNLKMSPYIYMIFCESKQTEEYCKKLCGKWVKYGSKKIKMLGYPRFDLYSGQTVTVKSSGAKTVLWTPRWALEKTNDSSNFFELIEPLLRYFSKTENSKHRLIIRPHPLMFSNFIRIGKLTENDVYKFESYIEELNNVTLDKNSDYIRSLLDSDLVISDFSSLVIEYLMNLKPVIYCGRVDSFDEIGKKMIKALYLAEDANEAIKTFENLMNGKDYLTDERNKFVKSMRCQIDGIGIGNAIANAVVEDYFKG